VRAHGEDLRAEVQAQARGDELVEALMRDYRKASLTDGDRGLLDFAVKLALTPQKMNRADVDALRAHGFDDAAIHDIVQITGLFSYYNRLADGLGIDPEPDW
jgi:uncharacterized peroxidase-related enzyme